PQKRKRLPRNTLSVPQKAPKHDLLLHDGNPASRSSEENRRLLSLYQKTEPPVIVPVRFRQYYKRFLPECQYSG
ncbi:MAG: hypothetical protein K6G90_01740, partial [Clostridia bacterium]|nr:hypothetical protein [Clostridia bacterium]